MTGCKSHIVLRLLAAAFLLLPAMQMQAFAQEQEVSEDFVTASLIVSDPAGALYSKFGHAAIHMECPEHNLDYIFTYEAEDYRSKILRFFTGKLNMGMAAIPTADFISICLDERRGVRQYELNLPIEAKRNLWRVLDNHLTEGMCLPYDYLSGGCAHSALMMIEEGLGTLHLQFGPWPEKYDLTRREIAHKALSSHKWTRCFLHLICNGEIDRQCSCKDKVILPADLVEVLSSATVNGTPIISGEAKLIVKGRPEQSCRWPSPAVVALILLAATIICGLAKVRFMDYVLLAFQTVLGIITVYLVFFSDLVCTEWSWLIIPFNPLPLIFWKWRRKWALPYAVILVIWAAAMFFWPHLMTDNSYIILAIAIATSYISIFNQKECL